MKLKSFRQFLLEQEQGLRVRGDITSDIYKKFIEMDLKIDFLNGNFDCSYNNLESLEGCPESVGGDFSCYSNNLESLEGCPESVGGNFYCFNQKNGHKFTVEEVRKYCKVKGQIFV